MAAFEVSLYTQNSLQKIAYSGRPINSVCRKCPEVLGTDEGYRQRWEDIIFSFYTAKQLNVRYVTCANIHTYVGHFGRADEQLSL